MRILLALDKFKDALTAAEAVERAAEGILASLPDARPDRAPLTDGGDGFAAVLAGAAGTTLRRDRVTGPLGEPLDAGWALVPAARVPAEAFAVLRLDPRALGDKPVAIVEMAQAAGLARVPAALRDPRRATTRGVGELLALAAREGAGAIVLGIGGSATSDLGLGALAALGTVPLDASGHPILCPTPLDWPRVAGFASADRALLPPLRIACDVTNPLLGPRGAAAAFGPQKGLPVDAVEAFDREAGRVAGLLVAASGGDPRRVDEPGAGAAGGLGWGLRAVPGDAALVPGFALVAAWLGLEERVAAADLVVTGEGRFDATSLDGKGPAAVVGLALALGKPVVVLAGAVSLDPAAMAAMPGVTFVAISPPGMPLAEALPRTGELLALAAQNSTLNSNQKLRPRS